MSKRRSSELLFTAFIIVLVTLGYFALTLFLGHVPESSDAAGHILGGVGLLLMLTTEFLYSARKRAREGARWGRMESWLKFHIITGLVGPYLVLLHTSWQFNGLAGVVTLLTLLVVLSGFVGRYIYTAVPRSPDGAAVDSTNMESQADQLENELNTWRENNKGLSGSLPEAVTALPPVPRNTWWLVFGRLFWEWSYHRRYWNTVNPLANLHKKQLKELDIILSQRRKLRYQIATLVLERRVLAVWHLVHVPIGIALFTTAFVHVGVAIYYVTLGRF